MTAYGIAMSRIKLILINLLVLVCILLALFVVLEVGSRVWLDWFASDAAFHKYASLCQLEARNALAPNPAFRYSPHRYLGYYPTPNYRDGANRHNALGYRGAEVTQPKPPGEFRIVCMGGSTTYTALVTSYKYAYPTLLQKDLRQRGYSNVTVVNAGAEAWTSYETLINFELRVLDLDPDMIIIYHGTNDVLARFLYPPSAYKGDNSGYRGPNVSQVVMPNILEYSMLLRILGIRMNYILPHAYLARTLVKPLPTDVMPLWAHQVVNGTYPSGIFKKMSAREILERNPPIYFQRNLENIIAIAQAHRIKTVLATFAYSPQFTKSPFATAKDYVWTYKQSNDVLKHLARTNHDVFLFDYAAEFPPDKKYWGDELHVNYDGAELKANLFADYLQDADLVPRPRSVRAIP